jgi:hypothetical protein
MPVQSTDKTYCTVQSRNQVGKLQTSGGDRFLVEILQGYGDASVFYERERERVCVCAFACTTCHVSSRVSCEVSEWRV